MRSVLIAGVFALAAASAVHAEPAQPTTATTEKGVASAKKTKKVCRREDKTGSVVPKRVCRTVVVDDAAKPASGEAAAEPARSAS